MHLYRQTGRKTYRLRWHEDGRLRSVSTGTTDRAEAERICLVARQSRSGRLTEAAADRLLRATFADRDERGRVPLAAAGAEYLQIDGARSGRAKLHSWHWRRFAEWAARQPGLRYLDDVRATHARAYVETLTGASATRRAHLHACRRVWTVVAPLHDIQGTPWSGIRIAGKGDHRPALTTTQLERLIAAAEGEYRVAIIVGAYTGLRYSDVAHLEWAAVGADSIRLEPHKTRRAGITVEIPLHPRVAAALATLPRSGPHVFPELVESYPRERHLGRFAVLARAARLPPGATYQSLRHTFVTRLAEAGIPEDVRRRLAGHSNARTHDGYTHDIEARREAVAQLE